MTLQKKFGLSYVLFFDGGYDGNIGFHVGRDVSLLDVIKIPKSLFSSCDDLKMFYNAGK